jgi:hypothetical protein
MKNMSLIIFFLILNATFILGQSDIENSFLAVSAKIGSVDRGYYNIHAIRKGMMSDDTNCFSGRVWL